jgi:serine protease
MSRLSRLLSIACLGAAAAAAAFSAEVNPVRSVPHAARESMETGRIIVKLKERTQALSVAKPSETERVRAAAVLGARTHIALADGRTLGPHTQVLTARGWTSSALATRIAQEPDVEWAVVDQRRYPLFVPNDPLFPNGLTNTTPVVGQWYLRVPNAADNPGVVSSIDAETAWDITGGTRGVVIADLDSGITQNTDLSGAMLPNTSGASWPPYGYDFVGYGETGSNAAAGVATANDGNAQDSDPSDPGDWISTTDQQQSYFPADQCPVSDSSWHGTQTAGIMSAQINNGTGMAGIAPGVLLLPVRVLGKCGGYDSDIVAGMKWAAGVDLGDSSIPRNVHPARVLNMSLGGSGACAQPYIDTFAALKAMDVVTVVAAGNDEGLPLSAPGNCDGATAVVGLRQAGDKVGFSDIGPEAAIAAPAGNCVNTAGDCLYPILTSSNTGTTSPGAQDFTTGGADASLGTSFAAPMVSATAALMLSVAPDLHRTDIIQMIQSTATAFPTSGGSAGTVACVAPSQGQTQDECYCTTTTCGAGMLNTHAAVSAAAQRATTKAIITFAFPVTQIGGSITLAGDASTAVAGQTITGYQWSLAATPSTIVTLNGTTGPSITATGVAAGAVTVQLTITDSAGGSATTTQVINVTTPASQGGGGGGGGGAANPLWLLALACGALLLAPRRLRR